VNGTPSVFAVNAAGTTTGANTTANAGGTAAGGRGGGGGASAFAVAYAEEARLAESRDADLTALRKGRAREAERSNAAAVAVRVKSGQKAGAYTRPLFSST